MLNRLTALEQGLASVPQYLQQHDDALRQQVAFFSQHGKLLADIGAQIRQGVSEGVHRMDAELDGRLQELQQEATEAHEQWQRHFRQLNQNNIYQKITEYLNPFTQLPAQQKDLNVLQERQAAAGRRKPCSAWKPRLAADAADATQLLQQIDRTNNVLEEAHPAPTGFSAPCWARSRRVLGLQPKPSSSGAESQEYCSESNSACNER